jgi:hypothetical protein
MWIASLPNRFTGPPLSILVLDMPFQIRKASGIPKRDKEMTK